MSRILALLGALIVLIGAFLLYARGAVFDADALGERAEATLADDADLRLALSPIIASALADAIPGAEPSPNAVALALEDPRVAAAFGSATAGVAEQLFRRGAEDVDLDLGPVAGAAIDATEIVELEGFSGFELNAIVDLDDAREDLDTLVFLEEASVLALPLILVGAFFLIAAIGLAGGLATGLVRVGVAMVIASTLGAVALVLYRSSVGDGFDALTAVAAEAAWDGVLGDFFVWVAIAGATGLVVALIGALLPARRIRA